MVCHLPSTVIYSILLVGTDMLKSLVLKYFHIISSSRTQKTVMSPSIAIPEKTKELKRVLNVALLA